MSMQYAQRVIESTLRWQEVGATDVIHAINFGVLATDGMTSHTGDMHTGKDFDPFLTNALGQAIAGFVPTHFTKDHIIPFA
mgnify:CR=1 FL=1